MSATLDPIPHIESNRLLLISMSLAFLRAITNNDVPAAQHLVDFAVPLNCSLTKMIWASRRLQMIEADPTQHSWMYRSIVRKSDNQMVGFISFHHKAPDPDLLAYSNSAAELGYTIEPEYRRNGYAKESALAMMQWASREHHVRDFILTISPANLPSLKLAESMGFKIIGEHIDDIDGLEFVMIQHP